MKLATTLEAIAKQLGLPIGVLLSYVEGVRNFIAAGIFKGIGVAVPTYVVDPSPLGFTVYRR